MLNTILLVLIVLLEAIEAAAIVKRRLGRKAGNEADAEAEEPRRQESRMDEGFENLMRFSVGGKNGFEMDER